MVNQDQQILAARQKRRLWVFVLAGVAGMLLLSYLVWLFLAKGYQLQVAPQEAAKTAQYEVRSGAGFMMGNQLYSFGGNLILAVSAPKFITQEIVVNSATPGIIPIVMQPAPAQITLTTSPEFAETHWYFNDQLLATGTELETTLPPGQHAITAVHPWYETAQWQANVEAAEVISETLTLTPLLGSIKISSIPQGATVHLNEQIIGTTPLEITRPGGQYQVRVALEGYQTTEDQIAIELGNRHPQRGYQLLPEKGTLNFELKPEGGVLLVNQKPAASGIAVDANKTHTVRYEKPGFEASNQMLKVSPGENKSIDIELKPEFGEVMLQANLPADVRIDGRSYGSTPLTLKLQTVENTISFERAGFRTVHKTITPKAGSTLQVKAEMLSEFDARRREGKPLFISTLGIDMKAFTPRAYVMGSPENEAFRRRNEHPVKVDFNRSILVSKHEITEAQFATFSGSHDAESDLPVSNVSWMDAVAFCHWLSVQEGLEPFYLMENGQLKGINPDARGYRLPTEAEWEWLAKVAGRRAPTQFSWGSQERIPKDYGNYADASIQANNVFKFEDYNDGFEGKAPVGFFKADRNGLFDLDGNVAEWVHDRFTLQPPDTDRTHMNYLGASRGQSHVVKGGDYQTGRYRELRVAMREEGTEPAATLGFRIARYQ